MQNNLLCSVRTRMAPVAMRSRSFYGVMAMHRRSESHLPRGDSSRAHNRHTHTRQLDSVDCLDRRREGPYDMVTGSKSRLFLLVRRRRDHVPPAAGQHPFWVDRHHLEHGMAGRPVDQVVLPREEGPWLRPVRPRGAARPLTDRDLFPLRGPYARRLFRGASSLILALFFSFLRRPILLPLCFPYLPLSLSQLPAFIFPPGDFF